jgi:hypothetical protein
MADVHPRVLIRCAAVGIPRVVEELFLWHWQMAVIRVYGHPWRMCWAHVVEIGLAKNDD